MKVEIHKIDVSSSLPLQFADERRRVYHLGDSDLYGEEEQKEEVAYSATSSNFSLPHLIVHKDIKNIPLLGQSNGI